MFGGWYFFEDMCLEKEHSLDPKAALSLWCEDGKVGGEKYSFLHRSFA